MKNTVHLGFISVILLMILLSVFWLMQIKSSNESVLELIKQYNIKIEHAYTMRDATRFRQANLLAMLAIQDPFELDKEIQRFYNYAYPYHMARKALFAMPMSEKERVFHKLMDEQTMESQPLSNRVVEMFANAEPKEKIVELINKVRVSQAELFRTIDSFVELQKNHGDDAYNYSRQQFDDGIFWVSLAGLITIFIAIFISRYVASYVTEKNTQLRLAGEDMEIAFVKAEEATILKSEFLATMSHEIRTPLTAIIGFAETSLFSEQTMEQRLNATQTIIRNGKHLLQIINDILDLSKVEANKLEIEYIETSLFDLLSDIENLERPATKEKEIDFSVNYIYPLPTKIKLDRLRVKQILLNLCNNAIKFTESGHVTINVSCQCEHDALLFEVIDSGIGISKEQQDIIFQAYRQADSSTTRKFGGTGLGLSLSKLLAERMGGALTVVSKLGSGSQFNFYLPCERLPDTQILLAEENNTANVKTSNHNVVADVLSGNILLAEDNIDNQDLFSIFLRRIGVDVTIVENGNLALEAVEKHNFDLILMDMRMPVMGGIEAVKLLRQRGFNKPIIAVTANAMLEDRENCFAAGCDGFLTKPVDATRLTQTLEKYLDVSTSTNREYTSIVSSLLKNDPEMITLVKRFVNSLSDTLKEIKKLIESVRWQELSEALHKLKGTGGNFGFEQVSSLAGKMEFQAANQNKGELMKLFSELESSYDQILSGLEND